ncbi:hypothetical protein [Paenibacillus thiaminolyticus]|nr:hypothetical protein [Paenibacillus thiaminolyticus]
MEEVLSVLFRFCQVMKTDNVLEYQISLTAESKKKLSGCVQHKVLSCEYTGQVMTVETNEKGLVIHFEQEWDLFLHSFIDELMRISQFLFHVEDEECNEEGKTGDR